MEITVKAIDGKIFTGSYAVEDCEDYEKGLRDDLFIGLDYDRGRISSVDEMVSVYLPTKESVFAFHEACAEAGVCCGGIFDMKNEPMPGFYFYNDELDEFVNFSEEIARANKKLEHLKKHINTLKKFGVENKPD